MQPKKSIAAICLPMDQLPRFKKMRKEPSKPGEHVRTSTEVPMRNSTRPLCPPTSSRKLAQNSTSGKTTLTIPLIRVDSQLDLPPGPNMKTVIRLCVDQPLRRLRCLDKELLIPKDLS